MIRDVMSQNDVFRGLGLANAWPSASSRTFVVVNLIYATRPYNKIFLEENVGL
jgi:hypothetical protein